MTTTQKTNETELRPIRGLSAPHIPNPRALGIPPALNPYISGDGRAPPAWRTDVLPQSTKLWDIPHLDANKLLGVPNITELGANVFEEFVAPNPAKLGESCVTKLVIGTCMGGVLGMGFGVIMASFEGMSPPVMLPGEKEPPKKTWKQELRDGARKTKAKSRSWGKNFAALTAMFQGFECAVEKVRGKHDIYNSCTAGCFTGAALARQSGPQAMAIGCVGFAAFSAAIDTFMGTH